MCFRVDHKHGITWYYVVFIVGCFLLKLFAVCYAELIVFKPYNNSL